MLIKVRAKAADGDVRFFGDDAEPLDRALRARAASLRVHLSTAAADADGPAPAPQDRDRPAAATWCWWPASPAAARWS